MMKKTLPSAKVRFFREINFINCFFFVKYCFYIKKKPHNVTLEKLFRIFYNLCLIHYIYFCKRNLNNSSNVKRK